MKIIFALLVLIAASAARSHEEIVNDYDEDATLHLVDQNEVEDEESLRASPRNPEDNEYKLFTRKNPTSGHLIRNFNDEEFNSLFDPKKTIVVLAHGQGGNGEDRMSATLTEVFLKDGDVNVIVLDWSRLASRSYSTAMSGSPAVGRALGQLLKRLVSAAGASYERMHLVGFGLGCHVVGNAGRETRSLVKRITALDPSTPYWGTYEERLASTDAQYVEVMHTTSNLWGLREPCGDADFYPNGSSQPGCWFHACSQNMAINYMAASVNYDHLLANECENLRQVSRDNCHGLMFPMGNSDLNKSKSGLFRINTRRNYPY